MAAGTGGGRGETSGGAAAGAVRAFICIEVPSTIKGRIAGLQESLRSGGGRVSWVKPSNIHLTLKFLGDVPPAKMEAVRLAVERAASPLREFAIEVKGAGCFPSPKNPRVLWVGLAGVPEGLRQLHAAIEDGLEREGFPRESKRFSPHLTVGRIRDPKGASRVGEDLIAAGFEAETFQAGEVILMRSDLNPEGSIYTPQAVIRLAG